jgi:hypothetical protein
VASNITLKAIAVKTGMSNSDVSQASYTITFPPAADPVFSVASGTYNDTQSVAITSTTSGASIYYTLDNTNPTSASYLYTSAVSIGKTAFIKAIAVKAGMTNSNISIASYVIDRLAPSFTIQYYSDSALSLSLGDTPRLSAGTYYLKIVSTKELRSAPTITIGAEGSANDVTNAASTLVSEYNYRYTRTIASDAAAVGSVIEDISISATDIAGNVATSINPSNESTKAAYTDTIAPTAAITCAPSSTVKQGAAITINAVINESLMSAPALKLAISGANTITATNMTRTDATHYTYSHTADAGGGSATIALSGAKDLAGNLITAAPSSGATFTIDNTTLAAATYKKVGAAPTTTVNDAYLNGNTLTVGAAAGAVNYDVTANATVKSIMGQLPNNNTFTIDSNGKVSAIDASVATGTPSIALTASQCAADVSVKGFADAALTLTGSAAAQAVNLNVTSGTVAATDANLTGTITMNTAAAATISSGAKTVTVGATAAANAVGITATGGTVSIDAAASAVSINGIKVDPSVTTTVTVAGANELSAAGGATTYTLDATTTAAKTFNFTTAAQTGAIAAKASEEVNGLIITSATAASNGAITITGGKVNVSNANLTGNISYNTNATATILSGTKALTIGATAAANAVGVTATGGSVSVDAAASAVTINAIKVDPNATAVITVNGANELSAAGGATNFAIDATTATAVKTFNFITTAQTGTISAKASEAVNGLTLAAAVASNGPITITGGKVDVSDADLTATVTYNTAATATVLSGTKTVTVGATAAANAVGITATGGVISVDAAATAVSVSIGTGSTVKVNDISVTPNAAASITVNGLHELSAAGGATNYTIDATTGAAIKIFNFITTGQTGTISAKASEAVNGLTLAAAVASNGPITITGGKVDVSAVNLSGAITYDTAAAATILSGAKTLNIGATAAANAVNVTATGGIISVDAAATAVSVSVGAGTTVKVNDISITPNAAAAITVNGLHSLSAAGGATNFTLDATTAASVKTFNFITTAQTGTISAKASEAVNGLTITAAAASNGPITITGGKIDASAANLTGNISANTANSTIVSGTKNVTTAGAFTYTITGTGLITIGDGGTAVISGVTVPGTTAATVQQTGTSLTIAGTAAGAVIVDVASAITDIILNAATTTSLTNNKAALASLTVGAAKTLTTLTNGAGNTITLLTDNGTITTISAGGAGAVITTLTLGTSGALTNPLATAGNLTITNIDQNAIAADRTIPLGSLSTTITSVKGHAVNKLTLTGTANANLTVSSGSVDVSGCAVGATFNITATGTTKLTATGVNIAAISGAQAIEIAGAASATVNGAVTGLTVSGAVTTLNIGANITTPVLNALVTALNITAGTIGSISGTSGATNLNLTGGTLAGYTATTAITTSTLSGGTLTTITKAKAGGIVIGADAASANALNATITGGTGPWSIGAANSTVATSAVPGNVTAVWNSAADIVLTWAADNAGTNVTFTGNDATAAATTSGGSNVSQLIITKP